jgi:hypothetical protein
MLLGMQKSGREKTLTFPSEFPFWELKSQWTLKFLEDDYRSQNSLHWKVPYIIGKLLERKCLKWAYMTHLDTWNTSDGHKKSWESNWQFDYWPLKVKNRLNFLVCKWLVTYHWKDFDEAITYFQTSFQSKVFTQSYGPPKLRESQLWEF